MFQNSSLLTSDTSPLMMLFPKLVVFVPFEPKIQSTTSSKTHSNSESYVEQNTQVHFHLLKGIGQRRS